MCRGLITRPHCLALRPTSAPLAVRLWVSPEMWVLAAGRGTGGHPLGKGCGLGLDGRYRQVRVLMWINVEDVMNGKSNLLEHVYRNVCIIQYVK